MYGDHTQSFSVCIQEFFDDKPGLGRTARRQFIQRFELNYFLFNRVVNFIKFPLEQRIVINMYLSRIISINHSVADLIRYELIRLYLIRTFRGRRHALGQPVRGQRARTNAATACRLNATIKSFIQLVKINNPARNKPKAKSKTLNRKMVAKRSRAPKPKIKMIFTKKKKNL